MNPLDKLRELDKQATQGRWNTYFKAKNLILLGTEDGTIADVNRWCYGTACPEDTQANAELIALMRNSLPLFLELVEAAEMRLELNHHKDCVSGVTAVRLIDPGCSCGRNRMEKALAKLKEPAE